LGEIAVNLFRAAKCSGRAKVYRGGIRGKGSYRKMAYHRKEWSIQNLCVILAQHAIAHGIEFGWKRDENEKFASWVVYVDLPTGQVSFHSPVRHDGPDYKKDWEGTRLTAERVIAFCERVRRGETFQLLAEVPKRQFYAKLIKKADRLTPV
jgi:hypothetical protein